MFKQNPDELANLSHEEFKRELIETVKKARLENRVIDDVTIMTLPTAT